MSALLPEGDIRRNEKVNYGKRISVVAVCPDERTRTYAYGAGKKSGASERPCLRCKYSGSARPTDRCTTKLMLAGCLPACLELTNSAPVSPSYSSSLTFSVSRRLLNMHIRQPARQPAIQPQVAKICRRRHKSDVGASSPVVVIPVSLPPRVLPPAHQTNQQSLSLPSAGSKKPVSSIPMTSSRQLAGIVGRLTPGQLIQLLSRFSTPPPSPPPPPPPPFVPRDGLARTLRR